MHEASWSRVKWLRLSWTRKTFCQFAEPCRLAWHIAGIISSVSSWLALPLSWLSWSCLLLCRLPFSCLWLSRLLLFVLRLSRRLLSCVSLPEVACKTDPTWAQIGLIFGPKSASGGLLGAGASWGPWAAPGPLRVRPRTAPGPLLGCSWGLLAPTWGQLGFNIASKSRSGGSLKRSWIGAGVENGFGTVFGLLFAWKTVPKCMARNARCLL